MKRWMRRGLEVLGIRAEGGSGDPVEPYRKRYQRQFNATTGFRTVGAPALFRAVQLVTSGIVRVLCESGPFGTRCIDDEGMPLKTTRAKRVNRMLTWRVGERDAHSYWTDVAMEYCVAGNGFLLPGWSTDGLSGLQHLYGWGARIDQDGMYVLRDEEGRIRRYPPNALIHLRFTGDWDRAQRWRPQGRGLSPSPVEVVSRAMAVHLGIEGFVLDWFEEASSGGGFKNSFAIVVGEDGMFPGGEAAFLQSLKNHAEGRGPLILPAGSKVVPMSPKPSDAQLEELRRFYVVELARAFGVPPALVGETSGSPIYGAGVEAIAKGFGEFTVSHHIDNFVRPIQSRLLTFGQSIWVTERSFRAPQTADQAALAKVLLGPNGSLAVEQRDVLRTLGLPPWIAGKEPTPAPAPMPPVVPGAPGSPAPASPPEGAPDGPA